MKKRSITSKQVLVGFCIVLLIVLLILVFRYNQQMATVKNTYKENEIKISELNKQVKSLTKKTTKTDEIPVTEEEAEQILYSAKELGEQVANLQNMYHSIDFTTQREAFDTNVNAMDACLAESSKSARVAWYTPNTEGISATWQFKSTYQFSNASANVIWICMRDNTDEMLAYAVGVYDVEKGLFRDVTYKLTRTGNSYIEVTDSDKEGITYDSLQDLINSLSDVELEEHPEVSEEEMDNVHEAQEKLREAGKDADEY